jgi:tetratricopeptide (TPR) repeat protein
MQKLILKYFFFLLIIFSGKLFAQDSDAPKVDTADAATKLIKSGNIKCDSAEVHLKKKDSKGANKFYSDAIKDYKKAVKINNRDYAANYALGKVLNKTKDYKNALVCFDSALCNDPKGDAFRERGIAQHGLGKDSLAYKDFSKAIDKDYNDVQAYYHRGMLTEKGRNPQSAIDDYTHAIESDPTFKDGYLNRGKLYLNVKKDYVLALADFNKLIELDPENNDVYLLRGKTNFNGGAYKNADKDLSRFIDLVPDNVDALITRGASRINIYNYSGAVRDFDDALKIDPKNVIALMNRGTAKGAMKNYTGALEDLDACIKIKFDYSTAYVNRALVKYANHDKKGACKDLQQADALNNEKAADLLDKYCKDENK